MGNIDIGLAGSAPLSAGLSAKTVAVTGGAGFIGSHLCDAILASGARVVCIDNFHTGRWENIQHLLNNSRFEVLEHDVADPLFIARHPNEFRLLAEELIALGAVQAQACPLCSGD